MTTAGRARGRATEKKPRQGPRPERPAGLQHAHRLFQEGGPRQQIHVGIEDQGHHRDGAAERPDLGKPVVALTGPCEGFAQDPLHRSRVLEYVGVDVGDDVGRHGHGQKQGPFEEAPPRKSAHGDQPGGADPDDQGPEADTGGEAEGGAHVERQDGRRQVPPNVVSGGQREDENGDDGNRSQDGDDNRADAPRIELPTPRHPRRGVPVDFRADGRHRVADPLLGSLGDAPNRRWLGFSGRRLPDP